MKTISLFIAAFAIVFVLIAGCVTTPSKTQIVDVRPYYSTINSMTGVVYNIPIEFPNVFDAEEMENFSSIETPLEGGFVILIYNEVDKDGEEVGTVYGLVFDAYSLLLAAALLVEEDDITWKFWIYHSDVPIPCTQEEMENFLSEGVVSI